MSTNTAAAQKELVQWIFFHEMLQDHIQNGAARRLYPQIVADIANAHLEHIGEALVASVVDSYHKDL